MEWVVLMLLAIATIVTYTLGGASTEGAILLLILLGVSGVLAEMKK